MTPITQPAPIALVHVMAPISREQQIYYKEEPAQFSRLNIRSCDEAQMVMTACKARAQEIIDKHNLNLDNLSRGLRWAVSTQLLQALLTGEQEDCVYEFNNANDNLLGSDVGFVQRAIDSEVSLTVDYGHSPANEREFYSTATRILDAVLRSKRTV